jgi:hypothetical protein
MATAFPNGASFTDNIKEKYTGIPGEAGNHKIAE